MLTVTKLEVLADWPWSAQYGCPLAFWRVWFHLCAPKQHTCQTTNNDLTHCSNTTALLPSDNASWCQVHSLMHSIWISCHEKVQMWKRILGVKFKQRQEPVIIVTNKHVITALNASVNIHKFSLAKSLSPLTCWQKHWKHWVTYLLTMRGRCANWGACQPNALYSRMCFGVEGCHSCQQSKHHRCVHNQENITGVCYASLVCAQLRKHH